MDRPQQTEGPFLSGTHQDYVPAADGNTVLTGSDIAPLTAGNVIMGLESLQLILSIMLCSA